MTDHGEGLDGAFRPAVAILTRDLFFGARLESAVSRAGWSPLVLRPADDVAPILERERPALVLVDLQAPPEAWRAVLRAARLAPSGPVPSIAFGSHKDLAARREALKAGATAVVANSKLVSDLPALVSKYAKAPAGAG